MYTAISLLVTCLPLLALGQTPQLCGSRDCPRYNVTETNADLYEVRVYEPSRWVATLSTPGSRSFMRLFRYIQGNNDRDARISMTVPVLRAARAGSSTMMFYVPALYSVDTPVPSDRKVQIVDMPRKSVYVRVFTTTSKPSRSRYLEELQALKDSLGPNTYDTSVSYTAGYHSPSHQGQRHSEVWLNKLP